MNAAQKILAALGVYLYSHLKIDVHKKSRSYTKRGPGRYHGNGRIKQA